MNETILKGWVNSLRKQKKLLFFDLKFTKNACIKDSQIFQCVCDISNEKFKSFYENVTLESYIECLVKIVNRDVAFINNKIINGDKEGVCLKIISFKNCKKLSFSLKTNNVSKLDSIKYRPILFRNTNKNGLGTMLQYRSCLKFIIEDYFRQQNFLYVDTPIITSLSGDEGAKNFIIPNRRIFNYYLSLVQSPQIYKQLLMLGSIEKYFQIAPCFRDESYRMNRHLGGFYQVDLEMCNVKNKNVILNVVENMFDFLKNNSILKNKLNFINIDFYHSLDLSIRKHLIFDNNIKYPLIKFKHAINLFGSDKPDLRNGLFLENVSNSFNFVNLNVYTVDGVFIDLNKFNNLSFKDFYNNYNLIPNSFLVHYCNEKNNFVFKGTLKNKNFNINSNLYNRLFKNKCIFIGVFVAHSKNQILGDISRVLTVSNNIICSSLNSNFIVPIWVIDYPIFSLNPITNNLEFEHNCFSKVKNTNSKCNLDLLGEQYDLVFNGVELGSGSLRENDVNVLISNFKKIGLNDKEINSKFGNIFNLYSMGLPPHGGFALGFERILMFILNEENIENVIPFPLSNNCEDLTLKDNNSDYSILNYDQYLTYLNWKK